MALPQDTLLPLRRPSGVRIVCLAGAVWITQDGERNDVVLEAGQRYEIRSAANACILVLSAARLSLQNPHSSQFSLIPNSRISLPNFS
jgi:hypothetical protein